MWVTGLAACCVLQLFAVQRLYSPAGRRLLALGLLCGSNSVGLQAV